MTTLYANAVRLKLETGGEVQACVQVDPTAGTRPKCLFLHGNPGSLRDWGRVVSRLSGVADIAAIDMPGFGRSPRPNSKPACLSLDRLADYAVAVAEALSWHEPFFLVGHSHGGGVAQTAAARFPGRVAGIVLIGTLGAPAHGSYRLLSLPGAEALAGVAGWLLRSTSLRPVSRRVVLSVMRDIFSPEPVPAERLDRELALLSARPEILSSMVHVALGRPCEQLLSSAPDIRCSVLFLHGEKDALVPPRCARSIHDCIQSAGGRSEFRLLPGSGHMLVDYQATEVADSIAHFVNR